MKTYPELVAEGMKRTFFSEATPGLEFQVMIDKGKGFENEQTFKKADQAIKEAEVIAGTLWRRDVKSSVFIGISHEGKFISPSNGSTAVVQYMVDHTNKCCNIDIEVEGALIKTPSNVKKALEKEYKAVERQM